MTLKNIAFIVNPFSGVGKQKKIEALIRENLDQELFHYSVHYTEYVHHGTEIAQELVKTDCDAIVAVGGDGSVNDVVKGMRGSDKVLGIIPCGSGNGLARNLRIPLNPAQAIKLLNKYYVAEIDSVTLNDEVFVSIAGIGFDAVIAKGMKLAQTRGLQAYTKLIVNEYPTYKERVYRLLIDGKPVVRKAWFISFANSNQFGFNTTIAPLAKLNDGLIDVCIVSKIPLIHIPLTAPLVYINHFEQSQHVEIFKAKEVKVLNNEDEWVNLDGEGLDMGKELHFVNNPKSVKIICRNPQEEHSILKELDLKLNPNQERSLLRELEAKLNLKYNPWCDE